MSSSSGDAAVAELNSNSEGYFEAELGDPVTQVWLNDVPLADLVDAEEYGFSEVYGVLRDEEVKVSEKPSQIEELGSFNGVGLEEDSGAKVYLEHPTKYTKGMGEGGGNHWHVHYYLEGRVEVPHDFSQKQVQEAIDIGRDLMGDVNEAEEERTRELWENWADRTGFREKGRLGRLWLRIKTTGPEGLGPKNINPYGCVNDLDSSGISADQLLEVDNRI